MGDGNDGDCRALLDRPIAFHRVLVGVCGGVTGALLLSQAIYWQRITDRKNPNGWWYKTGAEWMDETGMTKEEFRTARRKVVEQGLLAYEVRGVPATGHYRVDFDRVMSSCRDSRKLDVGNPTIKLVEIPTTSRGETRQLLTTETTQETTHIGAGAKAPALDGSGKPILIPITKGQEWPVPKAFLEEMERSYPAVDGPQTLLEIRAWALSNPTQRWTPKGVTRGINRWFEKEQNKPARRPAYGTQG